MIIYPESEQASSAFLPERSHKAEILGCESRVGWEGEQVDTSCLSLYHHNLT